ncbi:bifunctional nuclease family protein [Pseudonocardia sp. KRD291]|uniref:bifunctional nuclease family protein n=1 Tax=Pseudonocardia sp. KRD291 TaxID=2792007 RepID=UPI001C4A292F|nr:bifunctional nuclease family protein [Pseudonocardia sp. KRD291]MBW0107132.1 bifunctional nuclease family protein [Pseudonocardia sp. KRD291]
MSIAMHVLRLIVHARSRQPVLLIGEIEGTRCVPIFLRPAQAEVIAVGPRDGESTSLTQDVLLPVLDRLGHTLERIEISDLTDGVYTAELVFDAGERIEVKPSDALSIAVREKLPIGIAEHVLDEVGQQVDELLPPEAEDPAGAGVPAPTSTGTDSTAAPEEQLREFREFIDEVSPEDFRTPGD